MAVMTLRGGFEAGATALFIAVCWTTSAQLSHSLQTDCGYVKPFLITYIHEVVLGVISALLAICAPRGDSPGILVMGRSLAVRAFFLALVAFLSNFSFTLALRYTEVSSAMTLEQLTSVFIVVLSCVILKERYRLWQLMGLVLAVGGAVVVTQSDATHGGMYVHLCRVTDPCNQC